MNRSALHENAILAMLSGPAGSMNLIVPLYLSHLGYPVPVIGLMLALTSFATLVSRVPVAALYRPERSRPLLISTLGVGAVTFAALPIMPELISFSLVLVVNRIAFGLATTFFLARYLDMMTEGTDRRRAMGYYGGTQALGYTTSNLLMGALADFISFTAAWLYGTVFTLVAILLLFPAPELPPRSRFARTSGGSATDRPKGVHGWIQAVSDPGLCSVLNGAVVNTAFHNVLVAFFPVYATTVGLGATQVGLVRALYSGINMVARPVVGISMGRMSARMVTYVGLAVQGLLLLAIPFVNVFPLFMAVFAISAFARAFVVVSNSVGLAEDVDETRVSRGVATSAYSAAPDVSNIAVPILAGAIASAVMVGPMFAIVGGGALASYAVVELAVARWRAARRTGTAVLSRELVG